MDIKEIVRNPVYANGEEKREELKNAVREAVSRKPERHCFATEEQITEGRQMVQIGG